jgi:hypothetical protein
MCTSVHNVYSSKVVVMDEVHNMVRSNNTTKFGEQLARLRELLFNAHVYCHVYSMSCHVYVHISPQCADIGHSYNDCLKLSYVQI